MKECFSLYFNGIEIVLPKRDVSFVGDIGIVKVLYTFDIDDEAYAINLYGVVNRDYELVLGYIAENQLDKINIMKDNYILIKYSKDMKEEMPICCQYQYKDGNIYLNQLPIYDYEVLTDSVIKMKIMEDDTHLEVLFDILKQEFISNFYYFIDGFTFNQEYQCMVAKAGYYMIDDNKLYHEIITYIDINGRMLEAYYDIKSDTYYENIEDILKGGGRK